MASSLLVPSQHRDLLRHFHREILVDRLLDATTGDFAFRYVNHDAGNRAPFIACAPADEDFGCVVVFPDDCENVVRAFADAMDHHAELFVAMARSLRALEAGR